MRAFFLIFLSLTAAPAFACVSDNDCKGDRICVSAKCQAPAAAPRPRDDLPPPPPPPPRDRRPVNDDPPPPPPPATGTRDPLYALASEVAHEVDMPLDRLDRVLEQLAKALQDPKVVMRDAEQPVTCVMAYHFGGGGFIFKKTKGNGLIRCLDHRTVNFSLNSSEVGALVGGVSEWGVGLVFGQPTAAAIDGDYSGSVRSAAFGDVSVSTRELVKVAPPDRTRLYFIGAASGASADAGHAKLRVRVLP